MNQKFTDAASKSLVSFSGYSLPGFLEDCQIDPTSYPLQNDGLTLREISERMLKPFGLRMAVHSQVASAMDEAFAETTAEATETVKDYLTKLAAQKGVIITHDSAGTVIFTRADTSRQPIIHYQKDGGTPFTSMELDFNGQGMHSDITVVQQADDEGDNAGESSISNPYVPFVHRPRVVTQTSGTDVDTDKAARMALSNELKNLKLTITTDRWEIDGKVIKPNNMITVVNPRVYLYKKTRWFIEQVDLKGDQNGTTATLTCALPEVYNDQVPQYLFKGINLH
jgi:prophage tail gpP-like protein